MRNLLDKFWLFLKKLFRMSITTKPQLETHIKGELSKNSNLAFNMVKLQDTTSIYGIDCIVTYSPNIEVAYNIEYDGKSVKMALTNSHVDSSLFVSSVPNTLAVLNSYIPEINSYFKSL